MKRTKVMLLSALGVFICACLYCPVFHAMPKFMDRYDADPFAKPENKGRCTTCHTNEEGFGPLNKTGQAFAKNGYRITDELRKQAPEAFAASPPEAAKAVAKTEPKFDAKAFYAKNCAVCHGEDGKGGGEGQAMIVPNFTDVAWQRRNPDEKLMTTISKGKGTMPAFKGKMDEAQIKAMIAHIRSFPEK
ncbi:MAG: c-type cytochrome [Blastocatellia bacterium]